MQDKIFAKGIGRYLELSPSNLKNKKFNRTIIVTVNSITDYIIKVDYVPNYTWDELCNREVYVLETTKGFNMLEHIPLNLPNYSGFFLDRYQLLKRGIKCELQDEDKDKFMEFINNNQVAKRIRNLIEKRVFTFDMR